MNEKKFSGKYEVRKLNKDDIPKIYDLCKKNSLYYEYCPPMVTEKSIADDLTAFPPNTGIENKYYVGFFDSGKMIAVMDLIDGYPEEKIAFIGFFMTDVSVQNQGIGSAIIAELAVYLKSMGFQAIRLAWVKGNPQAEHFWIKNGFEFLKETSSTAAECVILAERSL